MKYTQLMWFVLCAVGCQAMAEELAKPKEETKLTTIRVVGARDEVARDEIGYSRVYSRDISTVYKGKQAIETYRGSSVADLFSGMLSVYSGDSRNSGALDPNIRGVQGQGRVPVTIDGTEQSITVWRGYAGSNNRNYVDPNLISSIYIEKGPSLNPEVRSGIGGSVAMKTLDINDVVKPGETYGAEVKVEMGNNAIAPRDNPYTNVSDYRKLPNPTAVMGGMWRSMYGDDGRLPNRYVKPSDWNDYAFRVMAGVKKPQYDALVAYAYRHKGNYFAGRSGAEKYQAIPNECKTLFAAAAKAEREASSAMLHTPEGKRAANCLLRYSPTFMKLTSQTSMLGLIYMPRSEVTNTSLQTSSWLAKANYYPREGERIGMTIRLTESHFGDIMPSRIFPRSFSGYEQVVQWPESWVKQKSLSVDYELHPKDHSWLDFKASVWTTLTDSRTNSAGGSIGDVMYFDKTLLAHVDKEELEWLRSDVESEYDDLAEEEKENIATRLGMTADDPDYKKKIICEKAKEESRSRPDWPYTGSWLVEGGCLENIDGRFAGIDGAAYYAKNHRIGINLSNTFKLHKKLDLTVMADWQYETLKAHNNWNEFFLNPYKKFSDGRIAYVNRTSAGNPLSSESVDNLLGRNWELDNIAAPRLGTRHEYGLGLNLKYRPFDWLSLTAGVRFSGYSLQDDRVKDYLNNEYTRTLDEMKVFGVLSRIQVNYPFNEKQNALMDAYEKDPNVVVKPTDEDLLKLFEPTTALSATDEVEVETRWRKIYRKMIWSKDKYGRFRVEDLPVALSSCIKGKEGCSGYSLDKKNANFKYVPRSELLERAKSHRGFGWAPQFGLSIQATDHTRFYVRYVESLRWPSIFEGTSGFGNYSSGELLPSLSRLYFDFLPEHAKNWELGVVQDMGAWLPKARFADIRLNYFHNTTKNIMDRDEYYTITQYDRHIKSGLELQARVDFGRIFADLGVTRYLRMQTCDKGATYSEELDIDILNKIGSVPECFNGGISYNGYLANMIQPKWSVTANLGTRLFDQKLKMGARFNYHSHSMPNRLDTVSTYNKNAIRHGSPYHFQPVFLIDAYVHYQLMPELTAELSVSNLTDQYYQDPLSPSYMPAPGRTIRIGLKGRY